MKYTVIDGVKYNVKACKYCVFFEEDVGCPPECRHPLIGSSPRLSMQTLDGGFDAKCPLKDSTNPCPFCGSTNIVELSFDDEGNELEEWMMTDANRESESEGLPGFGSWEEFVETCAYIYQVQCADCNAGVISKKSMKDAWDKWNWRSSE